MSRLRLFATGLALLTAIACHSVVRVAGSTPDEGLSQEPSPACAEWNAGEASTFDASFSRGGPRLLRSTTSRVFPEYPADLRDAGIQGEVVLRLVVDTLGRPVRGTAQLIASPHQRLTESVCEVLPELRYQVFRRDGRALRVRLMQEFEFSRR